MPPNKKKQKWEPYSFNHATSENEVTEEPKAEGESSVQRTDPKDEQRTQRPTNSEASAASKTSAVKDTSNDSPSDTTNSPIRNNQTEQPTTAAEPTYTNDPDSLPRCIDEEADDEGTDSQNEDDIDAAYEDGEIERSHRARVSGRKMEYHKRVTTSRRSRK